MVALLEALRFRAVVLRDETPVDVCSMQRVLPVESELPRTFGPYLGPVLTGASFQDCGSQEEQALAATRKSEVRIDSLDLSTRTGQVWLTVRKGQYVVNERFDLRDMNAASAPAWATNRIVVRAAYSLIRSR